jgi:hypothetical protein
LKNYSQFGSWHCMLWYTEGLLQWNRIANAFIHLIFWLVYCCGGNSKHLIHTNTKNVIIFVTHFKLSNVEIKESPLQTNLCSTELLYQICGIHSSPLCNTVIFLHLENLMHSHFTCITALWYKVYIYKYCLKTYFGASFSNQSFLDLWCIQSEIKVDFSL